MKIVFAPDSFKGSLSSEKICDLLKEKAKEVFGECETVGIPISDGGEGAVDVIVSATGGSVREVKVRGPLGRIVTAEYGIFHKDNAIIEMAQASGLPLLAEEEKNIRMANTYGTGQLIADALDNGIRKINIAIGGSAANDGGIGCAAALGVRFLDKSGKELKPVPVNLERIASIDMDNVNPYVEEAKVTVMCDVTNPLLGKTGAASIFGPQKGASEDDILFLEHGMAVYAKVLERTFGKDFTSIPGAGAAGGLGAGLMACMDARLKRGIDTVLEIIDFDRAIDGADLIITGEGRMDYQSVFGKVPFGVGMAAKRHHIPCAAIVGGMGKDASDIYKYGVNSIITSINEAMSISEAMEKSEELFLNAAERMFRLIQTGMTIGKANH